MGNLSAEREAKRTEWKNETSSVVSDWPIYWTLMASAALAIGTNHRTHFIACFHAPVARHTMSYVPLSRLLRDNKISNAKQMVLL